MMAITNIDKAVVMGNSKLGNNGKIEPTIKPKIPA